MLIYVILLFNVILNVICLFYSNVDYRLYTNNIGCTNLKRIYCISASCYIRFTLNICSLSINVTYSLFIFY
jgi:hypothetical protein